VEALCQDKDGTVVVAVYIQPRASVSRIVGRHGQAIKLAIAAPPVDGKANAAVIAFLANFFGRPKSSVTLKSGRQSRSKRFCVAEISLAEADALLASALNDT
jgi:uncharacterized protein (TIGR00251 family)